MAARKIVLGFVAGALAVLVFHQAMILALHLLGQIPNFPWSTRPVGPLGVPAIANSMFWGGLWGIVFMFVADLIPVPNALGRGVAFGILGLGCSATASSSRSSAATPCCSASTRRTCGAVC